MSGTTCYFAYGSNMHVGRLLARIPEALVVEAAVLPRHAMMYHKRGRDGSAKCNVRPDAMRQVAGVVYRIGAVSLARLDRIEGNGYRRMSVVVRGSGSGRRYRACCYSAKSTAIDDDRFPFEWYRDIVAAGAAAHGLPRAYVEWLRAVPARPDPNRRRHRQQVAILAGAAGDHSLSGG